MKSFFTLFLIGLSMSSCITEKQINNIEDDYLPKKIGVIHRDNFFVLTGCSGGGKSTLLTELSRRGYQVISEPGRQIVKEQKSIGGSGLPWKDLSHFLELALSRYLFQFNKQKEEKKPIFFDRGILDALQLEGDQKEYFKTAAKKYKYNQKVFMLPPWHEIYKSDPERKHSFKEAVKEYEELLIKYKNFGYKVTILPKLSVEERVDFILLRI